MQIDESVAKRRRSKAATSDEQLNVLATLDGANALIVQPDLSAMADADLIRLRAALDVEMKRRNLAVTVGQIAEQLAVTFFNGTAGRPNLQLAPPGTTNVDALSRRGERYSIKGILNAKKTGTIYPDPVDREKQLFEYLLVVKIDREWSLERIYEFDWKTFCECRSWDSRMNAWYLGLAAKTLARAVAYRPANGTGHDSP
jgi:hypothetical protein